MQIEDWAEFIKNVLSPSAFKTVGVAALRVLYQRPVVLTDGTGDGGVDAWLELSSAPSGRVPVQFHAGRSVEWFRKLADDIEKPAVQKAAARRLFFVCAQTPTTDKIQKVEAELEREHGIMVTVVDARALASQVHEPAVAEALAKVYPGPPATLAVTAGDAAQDAQLSFVFFHQASGDFRTEVMRSALSACLAQIDGSIDTEELLRRALSVVGGSDDLRRPFRRELEALTSEGKVIVEGGRAHATEAFARFTRSFLGAQEGAAQRLKEDCVLALEGRIHSLAARRDTVDAIFGDLGLLLKQSLIDRLPGGQAEALPARLNAVERRLADALKPSGGTAREALQELVRVASESVYGRALASAELFVHLTGRDTADVARVLTGRARVEVLLDTSVAMPILCAKLDCVAQGWVTSEVASELYDSLRARGIEMSVPHLYLEEMAAHLICAGRDYGAIVGEDPALVRSDNFFVAHYHSVCTARNESPTPAGFDELLRDVGLPSGWAPDHDFMAARRKIERSLKAHFERYGVGVGRVKFTQGLPLKDEPARPSTVLEHDRCVVRWLDERVQESRDGLVLCSQDRWLLRQAVVDPEWLPIDPFALADVMQIVRPAGAARPLTSLHALAAKLNEAAIERDVAVWDVLAELERGRLADRHLLRRAKQFKEAWLSRSHTAPRPHAAEWQRFKEGLSLDS
jgi:hypothetical protein